ncbi:MAG: CRISPR-associated endonuclease Cas1 [Deltaproteobacteria bacterium]|nr:CRISPR-associated endonuclease Cas1 [Deltaproteobacteria bacterium]MBW2072980.1 CRISPR-associated endonuclease Cas1 [Deltaproteobacteria bacterium]
MESIYVLEPGAYLRREGECLKIMKNGELVQEIPMEGLRKLTLIGYVSLTGGVLDYLIQQRVETIFMTPTGRFRARLALDEHRHVALRQAQYVRLAEEDFALQTAAIIVKGKLKNMARFLLLRARHYDDAELRLGAVRIKSMADAVDSVKDIKKLRGLEGNGTRIYFDVFHRLIRNPQFEFHGRNRRPPLDPVNAMLSFVYTMLTNETLSAIKACGLDPYLGSLHAVDYGRPSLACDLVEEYRSFLGDRLVLSLVNRREVSPEDFVYRKTAPANFVDEEELKKKRPVEMKPAISRAFVASYEEMMNRSVTYPPSGKKTTYRLLLLHQARAFAAYLSGKSEGYSPFLWEV